MLLKTLLFTKKNKQKPLALPTRLCDHWALGSFLVSNLFHALPCSNYTLYVSTLNDLIWFFICMIFLSRAFFYLFPANSYSFFISPLKGNLPKAIPKPSCLMFPWNLNISP